MQQVFTCTLSSFSYAFDIFVVLIMLSAQANVNDAN